MSAVQQPETKHQPQRTCVGCGLKKPQGELLRVASRGGSTPVIDTSCKALGRGAYVCCNLSCVDRAVKRRGFERVLKIKSTPPELRAALEQIVKSTT